MSLAGVGVDIVDIARMEKTIQRTPAFARRIFTDEERQYCELKARPAKHYAARFAAREAVLKALGIGFSDGVKFRDVSVRHDAKGKPYAYLTGKAQQIAESKGILEIALSLSCTNDVAVANAVAVSQEARPPKDEREDVQAQISRSFKEAKAILDELEQGQSLYNQTM